MERTEGNDIVPLTHEQLATLLGVGRSYASRVIQTFKAEDILETRRGAILVRNREALQLRACLCNEAVKTHFEEVLRGVYPTAENRHLKTGPPEYRFTKCQTTHCFLAFSEYIAPQRVRCARSIGRASFLG